MYINAEKLRGDEDCQMADALIFETIVPDWSKISNIVLLSAAFSNKKGGYRKRLRPSVRPSVFPSKQFGFMGSVTVKRTKKNNRFIP
jgi:hypothetical protein